MVVKKTFRYPNVFFYFRKFILYNHLCPNPLFRNINMEKGITGLEFIEPVSKINSLSDLTRFFGSIGGEGTYHPLCALTGFAVSDHRIVNPYHRNNFFI